MRFGICPSGFNLSSPLVPLASEDTAELSEEAGLATSAVALDSALGVAGLGAEDFGADDVRRFLLAEVFGFALGLGAGRLFVDVLLRTGADLDAGIVVNSSNSVEDTLPVNEDRHF